MDLDCFLMPGWRPLLRPASQRRAWMDATQDQFAYRCLPLAIANAHGWEILCPIGFEAEWTGGGEPGAVRIRPDPGGSPQHAPEAIFGHGVLTFHVEGILRTSPGWNVWVGGSPNAHKDAIAPLGGVIETDWSPFTFTMNWRFTRANTAVRFEAGEPFCFFFPVQRGALENFSPKCRPIEDEPGLQERYLAWSRARDAHHEEMRKHPPKEISQTWQKHYYRGIDLEGRRGVEDHQTKLRLCPFSRAPTADFAPRAPAVSAPADPALPADAPDPAELIAMLSVALQKRNWLLEELERHAALAAPAEIPRLPAMDGESFLHRFYAPQRPVILTGAMRDWPALRLWTPAYLRERIGEREVEFQGDRDIDPRYEMFKDNHLRRAPFSAFMDQISAKGGGNAAYLTAYNSAKNAEALAPLWTDLGRLDAYLDPGVSPYGMLWIGPAGTMTSLHHDLTNNFIAQIVGRKRLKLAPAAHAPFIYNFRHVFSEIADLEVDGLDRERYPLLNKCKIYDITLDPGEMLYIPLGWWHQVRSLDFSVTMTFTNFLWPNDAWARYPGADGASPQRASG